MNVYTITLLDYDRSFHLDIMATTEEEAKAIAMREEPNMTIKSIVCLT